MPVHDLDAAKQPGERIDRPATPTKRCRHLRRRAVSFPQHKFVGPFRTRCVALSFRCFRCRIRRRVLQRIGRHIIQCTSDDCEPPSLGRCHSASSRCCVPHGPPLVVTTRQAEHGPGHFGKKATVAASQTRRAAGGIATSVVAARALRWRQRRSKGKCECHTGPHRIRKRADVVSRWRRWASVLSLPALGRCFHVELHLHASGSGTQHCNGTNATRQRCPDSPSCRTTAGVGLRQHQRIAAAISVEQFTGRRGQ
mmetsp:Transcript_31481/g.92115  ORF Transcript_31481/g.92115 Transcript_31481/m.92115 type:complete len:254 (-) Transcript_31481:2421-3182(-)